MDAVEIACVIYYYSRKQRKKNKKRYWIHPLLETRNEFGQFASCFQELKKHQDKFFGYVRMSVSITNSFYVTIKGQDTKFRDCIQPEDKLVITLRYFATGCTFAELHYTFKIGLNFNNEFLCVEVHDSDSRTNSSAARRKLKLQVRTSKMAASRGAGRSSPFNRRG
ncbi:hypothetical protein HW555_008176 [Spodoptera exigua]|uniref:Protein ANTAGONIST OF LIKE HETEROCHROMATIN PROTEIN 1-like n=1 Tax=Spodoptera exigua TaxID=7107 RepID=A0A835GDJ3_SPOEX|nr:hypothetical protein HW555_008176 [Spodoptera exigua]